MKKLILVTLFFLLLPVTTASAHLLKTDGSIGAVIHLDPDDDPIVGQTSDIFFEIKDTTSKFRPRDCECLVTISQNDKVLAVLPIDTSTLEDTDTHLTISYAFPAKGIYQMSLEGKSTNAQNFTPFTLKYDIRVQREIIKQTASSSTPSVGWMIIIGCGILVLVGISIVYWKRKRV